MTKTIGILGCGWLGKPLAINLLSEGYKIKGTTTSTSKFQELEDEGIIPFKLKLTEESIDGDILSFLRNVDVIIINIPPGLRKSPNGSFVKRIKLLVRYIEESNVKNILFVSSTSVYGNIEGEITEETTPKPTTESGKQLLEIENLLLTNKHFDATILRFGGLIGPNRHPINHLAGKTDLKTGEELINLIHLDDCILMIQTILEKEYWNSIFNGVYPYHPTKKAYYTSEADKRGLKPPKFISPQTKNIKKAIKSHLFYVKSHQLLTTIAS